MKPEAAAVIAAIRATPWAIVPEYLEAIEAIAARALDSAALERLAADGHAASMDGARAAVAAVGRELPGSRMSKFRDGAAVIPMVGTIMPRASLIGASTGGTSLDSLMHDVRVAERAEDVERIVLLVDSPGGMVSALGEAADSLRATAKPITAFISGMGASAAYWLASQAGEIVMDRSASVGSIGVVATTSRQEGPDQNGRRAYEVVSSGAPMKRPDVTTDEGRAAVQAEVDAIEAVFVADVAAGRGVSVEQVRRDFGRGAMVAAAQAVAAGMADRIGTLEGVLMAYGKEPRRTGKTTGGRRALAAAEITVRRLSAEGV